MALSVFEQYKMIEIVDGIITIPNWNKHQTLDAYERKKERDRLYQEERRAKQRALIGKSSERSSDKSSDKSSDVAVSDIDKDIDIDKSIYIGAFASEKVKDAFFLVCFMQGEEWR
ncbi:Phage replication initiation [gut metagenome]|uniref:Phage replication initiation n=1 Tax=gut metagenome TaxID=749906 RepID=J9GGZ6_9ZZZZ